MRIAIEGCAHGELDIIYDAIVEAGKVDGKKVDLLLCCGDFQSTRNLADLKCMNCPDKYKDICSFYKYYSGEKVAPVLTIFIGGNHEATNYLQELAYGGWVAPNIYYLGYASVVNIAGIRIAGLSGIYKSQDFMKGHYEFPPYNATTIRSSYHIRNLEIFKLKQISGNVDIFMSHDWPEGVVNYGNINALLRKKPFFRDDIERNCLGSPPAMELLKHHYPSYWFAAHMHCKFAASVPNDDNSKTTKFLALDKCLPKRKFLQIIEIEHDENLPIQLSYDLEWLTVLFLTNHLLSVKSNTCYMPGPVNQGRWVFTPSEEEKEKISQIFNGKLEVPLNFIESVKPYNADSPKKHVDQPGLMLNNQTTEFCKKLGIDDPFALLKVIYNISDANESRENISSASTSSRQTDSFTEMTSSAGEDEGENDNFVIDTSPTVNTKLVRTPLKLPAARNNSTISLNSDDSSQNLSQSSSKSPRTLDQMMEAETDNKDSKEAEPNTKKFKRRNQAIYADVECAT